MYFRSAEHADRHREEIRLPEHYDGSAFSRRAEAKQETSSTYPENIGKNRDARPTDTENPTLFSADSPTLSHASDGSEETQVGETARKSLFSTPSTASAAKGLELRLSGFGGLSLDELLLLGLLLLLGREGESGEILLLLLLLLLCG